MGDMLLNQLFQGTRYANSHWKIPDISLFEKVKRYGTSGGMISLPKYSKPCSASLR